MVAYKGMPEATKDELAHLERVKQLPCCLCLPDEQTSITEAHHMKSGGKRMGHYYVLPYCKDVHHKNAHRYTRDEHTHWRFINETLGIRRTLPQSKIVPRC